MKNTYLISDKNMLQLSDSPFTEGGHRAIYFHPKDHNKCIKILLHHSTPEQVKSKAPWLKKKFRKLERFDENREEYQVLSYIQRWAPDIIGKHIPRCYGFEATNKGDGLVTDIYRDYSNNISLNLLSFLNQHGSKGGLGLAIEEFQKQIYKHQILSRALLLHNIVVQRTSEHTCQLFLVDGIGNSEFIPISNYLSAARKSKIKRKIELMNKHIDMTLKRIPF